MYRYGHFGVSMLVYAPVGFALLAAGRPDLAVLGEAVVLGLATLPDYDQRVPVIDHRGVTHTLGFALLVGTVCGAVGWAVAGGRGDPAGSELPVFGFAVGTLSVCAHLLGDVLTPAGIAPLWPLSGRRITLGVTRARNPIANYGLFALGIFVTAALAVLGARTGLW